MIRQLGYACQKKAPKTTSEKEFFHVVTVLMNSQYCKKRFNKQANILISLFLFPVRSFSPSPAEFN